LSDNSTEIEDIGIMWFQMNNYYYVQQHVI